MLTKEIFSRIMKLLRSNNLKLGSLHKQAESKRVTALTHKPDLDNANVGKIADLFGYAFRITFFICLRGHP